MLSRQVTRLEKQSRAIEEFVKIHGPAIRDGFVARQPDLNPETPRPDLDVFQQFLGGALGHARERLVRADQDHDAEKADDRIPRLTRDTASRSVRNQLQAIRRTAESLFGAEKVDQVVGFEGLVARDDTTLARQAELAIGHFRDPELTLPDPPLVDLAFDPLALAANLEVSVGQLREALAMVNEEQRQAEATHAEKTAALHHLGFQLTRSRALLRGLCDLAGRPDLSERLATLGRQPQVSGGRPTLPGLPIPEPGPPFEPVPPTSVGEPGAGPRASPIERLVPIA